MPVSFYALVIIIVSSFLLTLLPFAGFPYSWDKALTAVFGALIFGTAAYSLYRGYALIVARMERQSGQRKQNSRTVPIQTEEEISVPEEDREPESK